MNTSLIFEQLTVAILSTAISVPAIQRIKGWLSSDRSVELFSVLVSFTSGLGVANYYMGFDVVSSLVTGLFAVIGAEAIYQLLSDKLKTYGDIKSESKEVLVDDSVKEENGVG